MRHDIQFCTTDDGVRIAYAVSGSGPPLVKAATWLSHLEFDRQSPVWRHWIGELSRTHTLIRYDERGCGLSDWDVDDFSTETWVRDLETVVDAVGCDRFSLLGISQGAPVAIRYAISHPERVERMVLHGSFARGWRRRGAEDRKEGEHLLGITAGGWGRENPAYRQLFTGLFLPGADEEQLRSFNELQRISTSPENAVRFIDAFGDIDVRDRLEEVRVPTLVVHCRQDAVAPFEEGRRVAAGIPGSRFVALESENHIIQVREPAWSTFLEEVRRFLDVSVQEPISAGDREGGADGPEKSGAEAGGRSAGSREGASPVGSGLAPGAAPADPPGGADASSAPGTSPRSPVGLVRPGSSGETGEGSGLDAPSRGLLERLKRRKVGQWGVAYVAGAWVALEALDLVAEPWNVPATIQRGVQVGLVAGLPVTVVLAWYHGEGGRQRMGVGELVILGLILAVAVALMVYFTG